MQKTFISLGIIASAPALPAFAHEIAPTPPHTPSFSPSQVLHHQTPSWAASAACAHTKQNQTYSHIPRSLQTQPVDLSKSVFSTAIQSAPILHHLSIGSSSQSINLDLSSSNTTLTAAAVLHDKSVAIDVGGNIITVSGKTELTPSEYLAVLQVASGAAQTLVLDSQGRADGGSIVINQQISRSISNLVVPQGVTVIDLTRASSVNIAGNITDDGSFYLASANSSLTQLRQIMGEMM